MFGKAVKDLQSYVSVSYRNIIYGNLKYVTGYTGFSDNPAEQSGNFLALKFNTEPSEGVTTTVELVGGNKGPVTLDSDGVCVFRITDTYAQRIQVVSTNGVDTVTEVYSLSELYLAKSEDENQYLFELSDENDELIYLDIEGTLHTLENSALNEPAEEVDENEYNFVTE